MFWSRGLVQIPEDELQQRATAAYLGMAIGDALGATVEFMTPREIRANHGTHREINGGGWLKLRAGQVTDDTTMALALGHSILSVKEVNAVAAAEAFDAWMRAKPVDIGNTVRRGILLFRRSGETVSPFSEHDAGNGACMRTLPIALATLDRDEQYIRHASRLQAHITHNNPLSDAGTECIIFMIQGALLGASILDLLHGPVRALQDEHELFHFRKRRYDNPSGYIVDTLRVVFQALFDTETFEDCLVEAVNRGGDADTTGAIAGMVAGALYGLSAIPSRWLKALDDDIHNECEVQAKALVAMSIQHTISADKKREHG